LARKSNTTTTAMDKSSFFFTANCGVCHPGGAAMQYDRTGKLYFDRSTNLYGYGGGVASLPASAAGQPPSGAQLDGDYGFANPTTGVPGVANWAKNGVSEADCLMCHMQQYATAPGTASHDSGVSWHKRSALLRGFSQTGMASVANFEVAPTAGAGWASVSYVAGQSPPMGSAATINYGLGLTAGTLVDQGGYLAIPLGKIGAAKDANCRLCHSVPDGKKSGRTLLATTDVHVAKSVGCTRCHVTPNEGVKDSLGVAMSNPHQIGKGDITIGSVRNDLDGTVKDCAECHLGGADLQAPNPTAKHAAIPALHFNFMKCQACHIRHMDDDGLATPTQDIPELVIEMSSNGTQNVSVWSAYLGTDPLDPTKDLAGWAPPYTTAAGSRPFRWYPALRWYKGKLTTVKPLYTAWFGEWISGTGDDAAIRPIPLRLVRKALADSYASGATRLASLTLTPGSKVASGAPVLHRKAEIKVFLERMRDAVDTANPDAAANDIVLRPVLVRAGRVYFLNAAGEVEWFESAVGESHDFAVNHNVVVKRDPANAVVNPGPYGAGGCNDCHGPSSSFFYGKQLSEPAQYDYLDEAGTVPNPAAGQPSYVNHYEMMGYSADRAAYLTASAVPLHVRVVGAGSVSVGGQTVTQASGTPAIPSTPGATVTLTATPGAGVTPVWTGCTPSADALSCTVAVGTPASGTSNPGVMVTADLSGPVAPPADTFPLTLTYGGEGKGTVAMTVGAAAQAWTSCTTSGCTAAVANGATVTLAATPDAASAFKGWGIVCTGTGTCSFKMNAAKSVLATFAPTTYPLAVTVTGAGTVSGGAIACRAGAATGCTATLAADSQVTLTAAADAGKTFRGWAGACTGSATTCVVTMNATKNVAATFGDASYPLTVTVTGAGTGTVSGGTGIACTTGAASGCSSSEPANTTVTLVAAAGASSTFKGWSGCSSLTSTGACVVPMTSARSVVATFEPDRYPLTVSLTGTAAGTVAGTAAGTAIPFSCTASACSASVSNGAAVVLTATPSAGSTFAGWGVVCTGTGTCSFKMNAAKNPTAKFTTP
jgi:hypothetical protein